jgi:hypothetical protein
MATTIYVGGQVAGENESWSNGVPTEGDDAIFPESVATAPTSGLTLTDLEAPIRSIQIAPGATYNIPLITAPVGLVIHEGRGTMSYKPAPTLSASSGFGRVICRGPKAILAVTIDGSASGADVEELYVSAGRCTVTRSGGTDHAVRRAFILPHEARTILEITDGVEDVINAGELILNAGAAPTAVSMSAGQWTNYGAPSRAVISGGFVDWRRTTENESTVFLARGELATSQGAYIGRLTVGPHGRYIEGPGTSYGTGGASYIEDQEPILIEL